MKKLLNSGLILLSLLLALVFIEVLLRVSDRIFPDDIQVSLYSKLEGVRDPHFSRSTIKPRNLAHPYILYANTPDYQDENGTQHDNLGLRENEKTRTSAPTKTILIMGGSTTYGTGVKMPEQVWTHRLQELFAESGKKVEVLNGGLNYATTAELLSLYVHRLQHTQHDVLVLHTGGNDLLAYAFPDFNEEFTHIRFQTGQTAGRIEKKLLEQSYILRYVWGLWSRGTLFGSYQGQPFPFDDLDPEKVKARIEQMDLARTALNLETIATLAKANGKKVVLIPYLTNPYDPTGGVAELANLQTSIPLYQAKMEKVLKRTAQKNGLQYFTLDKKRFEKGWFVDNCHLTQEGQMEKARQVFGFFKNNS